MSEEWRDIAGYEGAYQVSDLGRVRSLDRVVIGGRWGHEKRIGQILKPSSNGRYSHVVLGARGRKSTKLVHRLVAEAFLGPRPEGMQTCHGVAGQFVNTLTNLRYDTGSANCFDRRANGTAPGRAVRRSDGKEYPNMCDAAKDVNGCASSIRRAATGKYKTSKGFSWKFI
jgi:hypothetical protein